MDINKATFYDRCRKLFTGVVRTSARVQSTDLILDTAARYGLSDAHLAYILATTYHETAFTMLPIREIGRGRGHKYGRPHPRTGQIYYGRGFVQLTWYFNYKNASDKLGPDFVNNPDLVMKPEYAAEILIVGSVEGWFTKKSLNDYIDEGTFEEFRQARKVINGMNKATKIANYAVKFLQIIQASRVKNDKPLSKSRTIRGGGTAGGAGTAVIVKEVVDVVEQQEGALNSGNYIMIGIGIIAILGAAYVAYSRWDDAGRPKLLGG